MPFYRKSWRSTQQWYYRRARRQSRDYLASLQVHAGRFLRWKELELQAVFGAFINTVQAEMALGLPPGNTANRVIASLASQ